MVSEKELRKTAKELNEVLGLKPPIDYKGLNIEKLIDEIRDGIELINPDIDEFTDETHAILINLGAKQLQRQMQQEEAKKEGKEKNDTSAPSSHIEEKAKTKDKKAQKPAVEKTRATVMRDILLGMPMTQKEMTIEMHRRFGGTEAEAIFQVGIFLRILHALKLIEEVDGGKLMYIGKYEG